MISKLTTKNIEIALDVGHNITAIVIFIDHLAKCNVITSYKKYIVCLWHIFIKGLLIGFGIT